MTTNTTDTNAPRVDGTTDHHTRLSARTRPRLHRPAGPRTTVNWRGSTIGGLIAFALMFVLSPIFSYASGTYLGLDAHHSGPAADSDYYATRLDTLMSTQRCSTTGKLSAPAASAIVFDTTTPLRYLVTDFASAWADYTAHKANPTLVAVCEQPPRQL